jgi:DNA-binding LytR/AlgR family response regulator
MLSKFDFFIPHQGVYARVRIAELIYVTKDGERDCLFITTNGIFRATTTLKYLEDFLPPGLFYKVNRSQILAMNHVISLAKNEIILTNEHKIKPDKQLYWRFLGLVNFLGRKKRTNLSIN